MSEGVVNGGAKRLTVRSPKKRHLPAVTAEERRVQSQKRLGAQGRKQNEWYKEPRERQMKTGRKCEAGENE